MLRVGPSVSRLIAHRDSHDACAAVDCKPTAVTADQGIVIALVVASASEAEAVMPTVVPMAAFSLTALVVASVSLTEPTSNSSTSLMAIV